MKKLKLDIQRFADDHEADYTVSAGSKIEYSETESGTYSRLYGLLKVPVIGEEPNDIDTTSLDNLEFETSKAGLKPAVKLNIDFNMENPDTNANINLVDALATSKKTYFFKITRSNGIVHKFKSKVAYSFNEIGTNEIDKFTLYLRPIKEVETTVPSTSA